MSTFWDDHAELMKDPEYAETFNWMLAGIQAVLPLPLDTAGYEDHPEPLQAHKI